MKDLQEIKDEYANEQCYGNWSDFQEYYIYWDNSKLEEGIDQIAIRYAQEQKRELSFEINESIKDLLCMQVSINEAMKTDSRWEGMYELLQKQIDRKKGLIKQAQGD